PPPVSLEESILYYTGLPSRPVLIARTGSDRVPFKVPTGPWAYTRSKELRTVGNHNIRFFWEDNLALKVHEILDRKGVEWTSTDVFRIGYTEDSSSSVVLWIGVKPKSLTYHIGIDAAIKCKDLLLEYNIDDVDVEIREAEVMRLTGPRLFQPDLSPDATVAARQPFTHTVGIPICSQSSPSVQGTAGFFLNEGGGEQRLFLVTARHVVLLPDKADDNTLYDSESSSQPPLNVLVFDDSSLQKHLASIDQIILDLARGIDFEREVVQSLMGRDDAGAQTGRDSAQARWKERQYTIDALTDFRSELTTHWASEESRILGHVFFSPPLDSSVGEKHYTQDLAVVAIDRDKIDPGSFPGNSIDLGIEHSEYLLDILTHHNLTYPIDRLLCLQDVIKDEELRNPETRDKNGEPCLFVLKRGSATNLTIGCSNNIVSYVRYSTDDTRLGIRRLREMPGMLMGVSKEWAILPLIENPGLFGELGNSGPFAETGDSGSVIVDSVGRIGGILTGGSIGANESVDVTYATPAAFIMETIRNH
ncbi:hypothetical protein FA95DRAFT_1465730, partial [Auriscalpium vulgare]